MKLGGKNGGRGTRKELEWKYVSEVEQKNNIHTRKIVKQPKVCALIDNVP